MPPPESMIYGNEMRLLDGYGKPIGSLDGAIDVHDADVHDIPVNEYFHRHAGITDTIAVASLKGATSVTVTDGTLFTANDYIQIKNGVIETTFPKITAINVNVLTLDRPLDNAFSIGDIVEVITFDMNVLGTLENPISFVLTPNNDELWHIVRFLFSMTHDSAGDLGLFGSLPALEFPVILRAYNATNDQYSTFTTWDSNGKIKDDMFNVEFDQRSGGQGIYGTSGRGSIKDGTGAVPKIDGAKGDYLEILIQSDLRGLESYRLKAQGHLEGT